MTDLRQAAQQALEALEHLQGGCTDSDDGTVEAITVWCPEVIIALRAALAEPDIDPVDEYRKGFIDGQIDMRDRPAEPVEPVQEAEELKDPAEYDDFAAAIRHNERVTTRRYDSVGPVALETVYETIIHWDEGGGKRSRRELARRIVDLYTAPPQRPAEPQEPVAWLRVIDEAMVTHHLGVADPTDDYETAKRKMNNLLCMAQDIGTYFAKQAEPVQEPIGYLWPTGRHPEFRFTQQKRDGIDGTPVYTSPPQRKPLTEVEIERAHGIGGEG